MGTLTDYVPKDVILPGGTSYIGSRIAEHFLDRGCKVAVPSNSGQARYLSILLERYPERIFFQQVDYNNELDAWDFYDMAKKKDFFPNTLVYAAGHYEGAHSVEQITVSRLENVMRIELGGLLNFYKLMLNDMRLAGNGLIIALTSAGVHRSPAYLGTHAIAQNAVETAINAINFENVKLGEKGITGTCIAVSRVDTPDVREAYPKINPDCLLPAEAIVNAVAFLSSPYGQYHTGVMDLVSHCPDQFKAIS